MLSDIQARRAKPKDKPYKLADENGLYLYITPQGGKLWRFNYRNGGKQKTLSFGAYPYVGLSDAREKLAESRKLLAAGSDPSAQRKALKAANAERAANSFEVIAREWHHIHMSDKTEDHAKRTLVRLDKDVFPWLGGRPLVEIEAPEILTVLRRIEARGANELAHTAKRTIGQIFRFAIATGRATRNPVPDLQGALKPVLVTHYSAITDPGKIGELLRAVYGYTGNLETRCAFKLSFFVMLRPGEVRKAEWCDINLDRKEWRIPGHKMKMRDEHIVPLSSQAIEILEEIRPLTGSGRYVFPSVRSAERPMSENTITGALRRLGYGGDEMTAHGFRSMASTRLNESHLFHPDAIERQLAHGERDSVRAAYNRAQYLPERVKMLQWWADYLDSLRLGAEIIPIKKTA
ncbi:integrase arm-type DNA-binding domain-containing protein [Methylomicrobium sp. Wu6]|uniref:tyrosine-type recombinase/integrase n=1 Tax=Methylomicrobium sp. Wu6 TaxID=3107928 RepID=UPI002DD6660E|nr:integrase arm-type DNA-binding domain-containing protein [Methylomicrobium sp. Wu6]MEC4747895.1 tyrosine-type recombinase/integrase [Methylomicrobium sp. Wu6]